MSERIIPLIDVYGSHLQIGQQVGEACANQIKNSIENARKLLEAGYDRLQLTWPGAQIQARKYLPFAEEHYPHYVDEMKGIAAGAGVQFDDVVVLNAMEAVTIDALHLTKCTSMAINQEHTANAHVLIAHNEDWLPEDEADVYIVRARPTNEPDFLAMTYGALLPNVGFNSAGIAQCCDSVYPNDSRIGIPRIIVSRAVLSARNISEAIRYALTPQRAAGYNHLLVHESGEIYSVEVSARRFALLYAHEGYMAHTNHFLDSKMQEVEAEPDELVATRIRYFRALRLLKSQPTLTIKQLQAIQKDHINYPDSICNHDEDGKTIDRQKTITALIMDLNSRQMHIAWGNPCCNPYTTYSLG